MTNQNTFSDLANADVYDSAGHKLGGVNNVYVFDGTEEPSWVTVNTVRAASSPGVGRPSLARASWP